MNYHNITHDDMNNGDGLRVVLWVSGCSLHCKGCQNPQTWSSTSGIFFDKEAKEEVFEELSKPYIAGLTLSGGHPLENYNVEEIYILVKEIKERFPQKTIWLYTGFTWENIFPVVTLDELNIYNTYRQEIVRLCDVIVDGPYIETQRDIALKWRGSSNQRVIDVQKSLKENKVVLYEN